MSATWKRRTLGGPGPGREIIFLPALLSGWCACAPLVAPGQTWNLLFAPQGSPVLRNRKNRCAIVPDARRAAPAAPPAARDSSLQMMLT